MAQDGCKQTVMALANDVISLYYIYVFVHSRIKNVSTRRAFKKGVIKPGGVTVTPPGFITPFISHDRVDVFFQGPESLCDPLLNNRIP